ncbi:hypothetical protein GF339_10665 [candidate division KSB3 bacterium]|uniref:Uncharacterized protein n=1 Tax=candidate division KSB3 bacterium TaxID=2044937 RepID=A0A9D5JVR5_9BACT|nr:hypothetical protein [candidate division KSB3 bacterium]MBD3325038.1 hypothetical protein [candidate division KSB3 bacterium]
MRDYVAGEMAKAGRRGNTRRSSLLLLRQQRVGIRFQHVRNILNQLKFFRLAEECDLFLDVLAHQQLLGKTCACMIGMCVKIFLDKSYPTRSSVVQVLGSVETFNRAL